MSDELDENILQDFLIEAKEILEQLSEQLVDLENNPDDEELLNSIFRAFHTIKGGAGFLALSELVDICHGAENVFDALRNGQCKVTSSLMDTMLQVVDTLNSQYKSVQNREVLEPASPELLNELQQLYKPDEHKLNVQSPPQSSVEKDNPTSLSHTEQEHSELDNIDSLIQPISRDSNVLPTFNNIDEIDDVDVLSQEEFERLLNELYIQQVPNEQPSSELNELETTDASKEVDVFEAINTLEAALFEIQHTETENNNHRDIDKAETDKTSVNVTEIENTVEDITDDEFETWLYKRPHHKPRSEVDVDDSSRIYQLLTTPSSSPEPSYPQNQHTECDDTSATRSDDEFESLLNELYGSDNGSSTESSHDTHLMTHHSSNDMNETETNEINERVDVDSGSSSNISRTGSFSSEELESKVEMTKPSSSQSTTELNAEQQNDEPIVGMNAVVQSLNSEKSDVKKNETLASSRAETESKKTHIESTIRVSTTILDTIMNMIGELVLVRNRLLNISLHRHDEDIGKMISNLDVVTGELQNAVMKTRMQPIKKVFNRFPRVVRDMARQLGKNIVLEMHGEETELDKNLVEALVNPLIHLVRNSVDHGIELPDERVKLKKSPTGKIILSASQEGDHIALSITDDGAGMDPNVLRQVAIERGIIKKENALHLSDHECFDLIFVPAFTSKDKISELSGRGVGMDVVKTTIDTLKGSIQIDSEVGKGTNIVVKVPLTLAILPTLMVSVSGHPFAFPLVNVNEIFHLDLRKTHTIDGQLTITVRDKSIPLFYLHEWLAPKSESVKPKEGDGHIVIVQMGSRFIGFVVDTLIGQEEVVIKPLGHLLKGTPGIAGATITSDGQIALILDVPDLLKKYATI